MSDSVSDAAKKLSELGASKGGHARAKKLTASERSQIAKKAAKKRWESREAKILESLPKANYKGEVKIGARIIPCAVLDDGRRVLSETGIADALGGRSGSLRRTKKASVESGSPIPLFLASKNLYPFIPEDLAEGPFAPIFYVSGESVVQGYAAEALPEICSVWLRAREAKVLKGQQHARAQAAEILVRGLAQVGIIALVDEATGYQETREKQVLQKILDTYLQKEFATWAKRFPDEFYREIFRLRGWDWKGMKVNRPSVVGKYTNDIVYERLAPGVLEELQKLNPADEKGVRKVRHHQFLTEDIGHQALAQHLHTVIGFLRASSSWNQFKTLLDRAFPKSNTQLSLLLDDESL